MTAGPVSRQVVPSKLTVRRPPGTSTVMGWRPDWVATTATVAQTPVPQDRVSPTPRSYTRIVTWDGATTLANSTLTPLGKTAGSASGGADRSRSATGLSTRQTRCGLPVETAVPR